jgi:hypothetical protein
VEVAFMEIMTVWRAYSYDMFSTMQDAVEWINIKFADDPERFVSIRTCRKPEALTHQKVQVQMEKNKWASENKDYFFT